ncbi:DNA polymerase III subunit gamma/tau [Algiphilus sp.]|uniref:DNA polymerase III subunit gamma/tau n=1 Tax=Algiphilus sp. TaxID=1872431 RepID=UPI003B52A715
MSYIALARRYRPRRFSDVLGQPSVVRALSNALDADQLHPALLLTGTRGVGKTTLARILAKALNCETGVSSTPCGICSACTAIDEGRFVDLLEIDAASRTKVDDTRAMLDNVQYAPVQGRYKIYLIDEVHMLSGHSFNALLKTLEEPPEHVKFVLATTDPQKLPITVLSRCLQLHLRALPEATIRELLNHVLGAEGRDAEPGAVALLAEAADGSMRDALSLLDQALAHAGSEGLAETSVADMMGLTGQHGLVHCLEAIADGDGQRLQTQLRELAELAVDHGALLDDLATLLQAAAFQQAFAQDDADSARGRDAALIATRLSSEDLHVFYDMAVHARRDLSWAPSARIGFEMAVLRMWCFRRDTAEDAGLTPADGAAGPAAASDSEASAAGSANNDQALAQSAPADARTVSDAADASTGGRAATPSAAARAWAARVEAANIDGYARELARNCTVASEDEGVLQLAMARAMDHLLTEERRLKLREAFGKTVQIRCVDAMADWTPVEMLRSAREQAVEDAAAAIEQSPVFRLLADRLGASLHREDIQLLH